MSETNPVTSSSPTDIVVIQMQIKQIHDWMAEMREAIMDVPALTERYNGFERRLSDLEGKYQQSLDSVSRSVGRVYDRLDEVREDMRRSRESGRAETQTLVRQELATLSADVAELKKATTGTDRKVDAWVNRGKGAWFVIALTLSVVVAGFTYFLSDINQSHDWRIKITETLRSKGILPLYEEAR